MSGDVLRQNHQQALDSRRAKIDHECQTLHEKNGCEKNCGPNLLQDEFTIRWIFYCQVSKDALKSQWRGIERSVFWFIFQKICRPPGVGTLDK